jgi:hypothetical protein
VQPAAKLFHEVYLRDRKNRESYSDCSANGAAKQVGLRRELVHHSAMGERIKARSSPAVCDDFERLLDDGRTVARSSSQTFGWTQTMFFASLLLSLRASFALEYPTAGLSAACPSAVTKRGYIGEESRLQSSANIPGANISAACPLSGSSIRLSTSLKTSPSAGM